jgi:hypothetical protein
MIIVQMLAITCQNMPYFDQDRLNVQVAYENFKGQNCNGLFLYVLYIIQKCWTKLITLQVGT